MSVVWGLNTKITMASLVRTTTAKFKNGVFTLKTHQMSSFHYAGEILKPNDHYFAFIT